MQNHKMLLLFPLVIMFTSLQSSSTAQQIDPDEFASPSDVVVENEPLRLEPVQQELPPTAELDSTAADVELATPFQTSAALFVPPVPDPCAAGAWRIGLPAALEPPRVPRDVPVQELVWPHLDQADFQWIW